MNIKFVNMVRLFDEYHKTIEKSAVFQQQKAIVDEEASRKYRDLQQNEMGRRNMIASATSLSLTDDDRQAMLAKVRDLEADFVRKREVLQQFANQKTQELKAAFATYRNQVVAELQVSLKEYAKNNQIDMILDVSGFSGNNVPVVMFHDATKDVTDALLTDLNKGHEDEVASYLAKRQAAIQAAAEKKAE
jgi:Skp family chaperone for outer membrane proteins